ncbi:MAG: transposase, partial [Rhodobacteraceae bacterium]|nr:transposase [Paracoccaceae bacterium]
GGDVPAKGKEPAKGDAPVGGDVPAKGNEPAKGDAPLGGDVPAKGKEPAKGDAPVGGDVPAKGKESAKGDAPVGGEVPAKGWQHDQWAPLSRLIGEQLAQPEKRPFWLLGTDVTPAPRPFARTLADRGVVYAPNPAPGNRPIAVGHSYSVVAALPEKPVAKAPPWVVPLSVARVPTATSGLAVGAAQLKALCTDGQLPFAHQLTVDVADSAYSARVYTCEVGELPNLVTVTRLPANRVVYRSPDPGARHAGPGHPLWYGARFALGDSATWGAPDQTVSFPDPNRPGRQVTLQVWFDMRQRGKRDLPMHLHPFTLVRCTVTDARGRPVYKRAMWLIILGSRRAEVTAQQAWSAYRQRYDLEHFFRFGKQRLLLGSYQTPEVEHEEHWWSLAALAYVQLWLAQPLAQVLPNPWEPQVARAGPDTPLGPSLVQRDFERIVRQFGTPARSPKPRGVSPGRSPGQSPGKRLPQAVVFKKASSAQQQAA